MPKLHMKGSGSDHSTIDWWLLVSVLVANSGPKSPPINNTNGVRAYFLVHVPAQVSMSYIASREAPSKSRLMARTIRALPDEVKWNAENIEAGRVSPFDCHKAGGHGVSRQDRPVREGDTDQLRKRPNGGKIHIKGEDLRVYGYTDSCPRCDHERRFGPGRTTKGHSDACRCRLIAELAKTRRPAESSGSRRAHKPISC